MPSHRFTERERLDLLAAAVVDYLDENYTDAELELDSEKAELYNLAAGAVLERDSVTRCTNQGRGDAGALALDRALDELVEYAGEGSRVAREWERIDDAQEARAR